MHDAQSLSAHLAADLLADPDSTIPGELIADIVQGVLDEHRQDAHHLAPASLVREARHRLERVQRARSDDTINRQPPGDHR